MNRDLDGDVLSVSDEVVALADGEMSL